MTTYEFPKDFLWGTATSAYQTEGNNYSNDWFEWEKIKTPERKYPLESCGLACDSYNRYEEDFDLCAQLNNNAIRLSVEWSRLEPEPGVFDAHQFEHYKKVLRAAKSRYLKTFVTLQHFTLPVWFAKKGGWANIKSPGMFARYTGKCAQEFRGLVDSYATINEPQVYTLQAYTNGMWPPNIADYRKSLLVQVNLMRAHSAGYNAIKKVTDTPVGLVKNIVWYYAAEDSNVKSDMNTVKTLNFMNSDFFLWPVRKKMDFIGLNYYFTTRLRNGERANLDDVMSDLGWWVNPKGLERVLMNLKKYNLPVYVTENGVADAWDKIRKAFIRDMLVACHNAMSAGVKLKGYFYWSLLDNYEWHQGYWPKFGLVEVDRSNNLQRKPRPSFYYYADICLNGKIEA